MSSPTIEVFTGPMIAEGVLTKGGLSGPVITVGPRFSSSVDVLPERSELTAVAGGFNCVVEISADAGRRHIAALAPPIWISAEASHEEVRSFTQAASLLGEELRRLGERLTRTQDTCVIAAVLAPVDLEFLSEAQARISYAGDLVILGRDPRPITRGEVAIDAAFAPVLATHAQTASHWPHIALLGRVGVLELTLTCPVRLSRDVSAKQCDVVAFLAEGTIELTTPVPIVDSFTERFLGDAAAKVGKRISATPGVPLAPTISPVGANPAAEPVSEFAQFEVVAAVAGQAPNQALAVCFDLESGRHGSPSAVRHFIGGEDYGVISEEYVFQQAFAFGWRKGGFARSVRFEEVMRVQRPSGELRDALVKGLLTFDTLEQVEFATDADGRRDFVVLYGRATPVAATAQFFDGAPPQPTEFGGLGPTNWTLITTPTIHFEAGNPKLDQLRIRTGIDGHRRIACPFARVMPGPGPVDVVAVSLNAIQKKALFLGKIDGPLI